MTATDGFAVHVICLLILTPLSLQKSTGSPRAITRWELEFVGLHFHQSLGGYPCGADGTLSNGLPVSVVVGYTLLNSHTGKVGLTIERPEVSCPDGTVRLGSAGSSNRMTISVQDDKACSREARLELYINIHTTEESNPLAYFHRVVYSGQAGPDWAWALLPDTKETTLLALKWRMSCGEQVEPNPGFMKNSIRLKRQATDEDPTENTLPDSGSETKHSSYPTSKTPYPGLPETSLSPQMSVTQQGEGLSTLPEDAETFSSGEPPDSFVTGISEIFGLTKEPSSTLGSKPTHPSTASRQFTTLLQTLFGPTADVTTLIDRSSSSFSTHPVSVDNVYTSLSSSDRLPPSPTKPHPGSDPGFTEHKTTSTAKINAPAARDGNNPSPGLNGSTTESDLNITVKPDTEAPQNSTETVVLLAETTPVSKQSEDVDKSFTAHSSTAGVSATNSGFQDGVSTTQRAREMLRTTPGDPGPTSKTYKPEEQATSDSEIDRTEILSTTLTRTTKPSTTTTTTTTTSTTSTTTKRTTSPSKITTTTLKTTAPTTTSTTTTTTTTTTTKPDKIFTASRTKPTPAYPETSNEAYMGKTGEGSPAGRVDEQVEPGTKGESESTNEATLWPVVMGLVIGIPTIIVIVIAVTVVQKKHIGVPHRHLSSPGYFERRPPPVPFV